MPNAGLRCMQFRIGNYCSGTAATNCGAGGASSSVRRLETSSNASILSPSAQSMKALQPIPHSLPWLISLTLSLTLRSEDNSPSQICFLPRLTCSAAARHSIVVHLMPECVSSNKALRDCTKCTPDTHLHTHVDRHICTNSRSTPHAAF